MKKKKPRERKRERRHIQTWQRKEKKSESERERPHSIAEVGIEVVVIARVIITVTAVQCHFWRILWYIYAVMIRMIRIAPSSFSCHKDSTEYSSAPDVTSTFCHWSTKNRSIKSDICSVLRCCFYLITLGRLAFVPLFFLSLPLV